MSELNRSRSLLYRSVFYGYTSLPGLFHPLERDEDYKPFFIIGSGRSGSTLLRRILNDHSSLYIPPETYMLGGIIKKYVKHPLLSWGEKVQMVFRTMESYPEFHTFNLGSLSDLTQKVSNCDPLKRSLAYILNAFYLYYREVHQLSAERWGDKTPVNTKYLFEIDKTFPRSQYIHLIRNPYDTVFSYKSAGLIDTYADAAERWGQSVISALALKGAANSYYQLEYEALVRSPEPCISELCQFLKIEFEPEMLNIEGRNTSLGDVETLSHHGNVKNPINTSSVGKGLKQLSENEIDQITVTLKKFDHPVINQYLIQSS